MKYKGRYSLKNPEKYKGNPTNITYRSSWELGFMNYLDTNSSIIEWASEELAIPYWNPVDQKWHRYFPDFRMVAKTKDDKTQTYLIEIKPDRYTRKPDTPKRRTKTYLMECLEFERNTAKWKACQEYCDERKWIFKILTEKHLNIPYRRQK